MLNFILGFLSGAFVAQNYEIPNIESLFKDCLKSFKNYEKQKKMV
jgi:hypothetical protein